MRFLSLTLAACTAVVLSLACGRDDGYGPHPDGWVPDGWVCYDQAFTDTHLLEVGEELWLIAFYYDLVWWGRVHEDGTLEQPGQYLPEGLPWHSWPYHRHRIVPWYDGFRLLNEKQSVYLRLPGLSAQGEFEQELVQAIPAGWVPGWQWGEGVFYTSASPIIPPSFTVERVFVIEGQFYAVWAAVESSSGREETCVAGLGLIDHEDRVTAVGEPFYHEVGEPDATLLRFPGGWDPDQQSLWVDRPGGGYLRHIWELDLAGSVLQLAEVNNQSMPYLLQWVKWPCDWQEGCDPADSPGPQAVRHMWFGLHGVYWCPFSLLERYLDDCQTFTSRPAGGLTSSGTQLLNRQGRLWVAKPTNQGVVMRWLDDPTGALSDEVFTPIPAGRSCVDPDILF